MATRIPLIDVYSFYNELDSRVIEAILEGQSISCAVRTIKTTRTFDPAINGTQNWREAAERNETKISVEHDKLEAAKKIIYNAIQSGVISREGKFWN